MASIFSRIVSGEIPCYKVDENEKFLAFLDLNPLRKGHTLVIPKTEVDYIFDIDDSTLAEMIVFAKVVSKKIRTVFPCRKIGMTVIGLEVPHAHIHLIPIDVMKDMDFTAEKLKLDSIELAEISAKLLSL
ncbi:MAG: HIT family protein [Crocinitomicaceae bacterium]|jgi:histidine triad (HIT) family protein|nr:HIT family protein [Crocinitomicaceae bacterium]MBK6951329.1 HIT family protein [Crocinitomicaceae bacterium]MBK9590457.1 HIT family protein [Crocinitomicaceae bacterium]